MPSPEQIVAAKRLHEMGWSYQRIGDHFGVGSTAAWRWVNPERYKAERARNADSRHQSQRTYDSRPVKTCTECGAGLRRHNRSGFCINCHKANRELKVLERRWQLLAWLEEGRPRQEMADQLGWSRAHLQTELHEMRQAGYPIPYGRFGPKPKPPALGEAGGS